MLFCSVHLAHVDDVELRNLDSLMHVELRRGENIEGFSVEFRARAIECDEIALPVRLRSSPRVCEPPTVEQRTICTSLNR